MRMALLVAMLGALTLGGCKKAVEFNGSGPVEGHGRYAGIGVFDAGRLWSQASGTPGGEAAAARLDDDEHVIVVVDSMTGEVRQCGDHSGYCFALSPWAHPVPRLPARLYKHAAELAAEDRASNTTQ